MQAVARRTRRTVAAAILLAAVLGAAGCSSSDDDAADLDLGASGTVPSSPDGGRRTTVADEPDLLEAARDTVDADPTSLYLHLEGTSGQGSGSQEVSGSFDHETVKGTLTIQGAAGMEVRIDGATTWLRPDPELLGTELPAGATWIAAPTDELERMGLVSTDPGTTWGMLYLLAGATDVESEGSGRYSFEVDLDAVEDGPLTRSEREAARFALQYSDPDVFESVGGTLRLDDAGRIVEFQIEVVGDEDVLGSEMTMTFTLAFDDFGVPVTVQPPPPSEVVSVEDHPELLDQLAKMGQQLENA